VLLALAVMGVVLWFATGRDASWLASSATERAIWLTWAVLLGVASYFVTLWLLGFRLREFAKRGME